MTEHDLALLDGVLPELRRIRAYISVALEDLSHLEGRGLPEDERLMIGSHLLAAQGDLTAAIGDEDAA